MEELYSVEFIIPLSGSQIFDIYTELNVEQFCSKFPGLKYEVIKDKEIKIFGELNTYWYSKWNKELFNKIIND